MPGIPACVRYAGEFRWHVILGSAMCGGIWYEVRFVLCWWKHEMVGCVLQ